MPETLEETPVYGGDTKPAMVKYIGLPMTAVGLMFVAMQMSLNLFGNWRYKIGGVVAVLCVGVGLWAIYRHDHNALREWWLWFKTKFRSFDSRYWSGATLEPFPVKTDRTPVGFFDE